jgi:hypothetical protein
LLTRHVLAAARLQWRLPLVSEWLGRGRIDDKALRAFAVPALMTGLFVSDK